MKKIIALTLLFALLLTGCGSSAPVETAAAPLADATEPATEPPAAPTEPPKVYRNPLNGQILDEPFTDRIVAVSITNTEDAIPHVGIINADLFFEAYVSRGVVRCTAMFTDISDLEAIGAIRSTRLLTNQLAFHYDAVLIHGGGFDQVLQDARGKGLDHFNVDSLYRQGDPFAKATAYRDKTYKRQAPNNLFGYGPGILDYLENNHVRMTQPEDKDYGLSFVEDATPAGGAAADEIKITFGQHTKTTTMVYNEETGKYAYHQYGKRMTDQVTGQAEEFNNVIIMRADLYENYIYQEANFQCGGTGYYACGGKLIPIVWECAEPEKLVSPFRFMTEDGKQLDISQGNSYIAIINAFNEVEWKEVIPPETVPATTEAAVPETTAETVAETAANGSA